MNIRHLITKSFDSENQVSNSLIIEGAPYSILLKNSNVGENISHSSSEELPFVYKNDVPDEINLSKNLTSGKSELLNCPIGSILCDKKDNIRPLSQLYDYKVPAESDMSNFFNINTPFTLLFENKELKGYMNEVCMRMFPYVNPNTNRQDIDLDAYYTPYIPLTVLTGVVLPQMDENDKVYFNPNGTVTVAEFIDSLNAIKYGANSNIHRKKSIDNISTEDDYFNEGYQECLRGISSPFYNLYTREELVKPITRLEAAYITVICWNRFIEHFNNIYSNPYYIGINFDWEHPFDYMKKFEDCSEYKICQVFSDKQYNIVSLNIKDYKGESSMSKYKEDLLYGKRAIPLPMFMSMIELDIIKLFNYTKETYIDGKYRLDPLKEMSRGELSYFVTMLAKIFPTRYIS